MMISTRGRYALRVITDLAEHGGGEYIPLKEVADRQDISQKYLEGIMVSLSKAGLVESAHGKGGGYRLVGPPEEYRVGDILRATEGSLAPVSCLEDGAAACPRAAECRTLPMWKKLYATINEFFDGMTVADLMKKPDGGDYVI
jgi:Rrf2 family iron-sulfur cluster assembly transcriptional regulator